MTMLRGDLKIIAWNVNSIRGKVRQEEVRYFLYKHKPHILLMSETKLLDCNIVQFPGYSIYRNDRLSDNGGGTAILIRVIPSKNGRYSNGRKFTFLMGVFVKM